MACKLKISNFVTEDLDFIKTTLVIKNRVSNYKIEEIECFDVDDGFVYLPFSFTKSNFEISRKICKQTERVNFLSELRNEQINIKNLALDQLRITGSALIAACPGFGKTITAINIACELKVKTLIVVNKLILIEQWKESINKFCDGKVQYVQPSTETLDETATFYVVNAINISKKPKTFWNSIELLIVDELHQVITKILLFSLLKLTPHYLIGLSATPYRYDDYHKAINWIFGKDALIKPLFVFHTVYCVKTDFFPDKITTGSRGIDWNNILQLQSENNARNDIIVNSVRKFPDKMWMILVKRINHATILVEKFTKLNVKCTTLLGSEITFDKSCHVLIGTTKKIGVGFDHADINALCIAADVKNYFEQFLGRCMRKPDSNPIVLDFEDKYFPLKNHFVQRLREYKNYGGVIKYYE
jgi:superfamily II DNA or RNA helicase